MLEGFDLCRRQGWLDFGALYRYWSTVLLYTEAVLRHPRFSELEGLFSTDQQGQPAAAAN